MLISTLKIRVLTADFSISGAQLLFSIGEFKRLIFITEVESVYSAVRTESLYKTDTFRL
jgi:hypothetical protein